MDKIIQVMNLYQGTDKIANRTAGRVYYIDGIAPTVRTPSGGGNTPLIIEIKDVLTNTQTTITRGNLLMEKNTFRIRKLTPRECFRLMGVDDKDIDTIQQSGVSNSQQYKMAGNSIVVDVLYHIFRKAFVQKENESKQLELW